jgi:hypothetical protein
VQVICPKCGRAAQGADIDISSRLAVCRPCGEVLPIEPPFQEAPLALRGPDALFRPTDLPWIEGPLGERAFRVVIRSRSIQAIFQLVFAGFWTALLLVLFAIAQPPTLALALLLLPLFGLGCFVGYRASCALNGMVVVIDPEAVTAARGPVPERGGLVSEPTVNVVGFKASANPVSTRGGHVAPWGLYLLTRDGRAVPLRVGLADSSHAQYAAARLTQMLDLAKRKGAPYRG